MSGVGGDSHRWKPTTQGHKEAYSQGSRR